VGKVAVLAPAVQGQIAAGEVIERPASVVKELVENALDAGARHVEVELAGGGLERISVRDDGEGMAADDAVLAFSRHATSKLTAIEELETVGTLGFRGEALPSIAAVGQVRVVTRRAADAGGVAVEASGEGARHAGAAGSAPGTQVEVRELFASTPARRKFLRTPATEVGHVVDVLTRLAVGEPEVGFRLVHDGREVLAFPPVRDLHQRLAQVLGRERAAAMVPVEAAASGYAVRGYLASPREHLGNARLLWTYIETGAGERMARRWVRDRLLLRAVLDGYESLLLRGRYPIVMLFLRVPPGEIDVNVHPAKLEVRFRRAPLVHQLIVPALRSRLTAALAPGLPERTAEASPGYTPRAADASDPPALPLERGPQGARALETPGLFAAAPGGFASLRFIGQIFAGYLLCEGEGRVVLIDQHAAHERVVFERLRAERRKGGVARDALLVPETVELAPAEAALLAEHGDALTAAGLEGEPFGPRTYLLRTVPRLLRGRDAGALLRAIAAELSEEGASTAAERAADAALATIACHSVVRVGQRLDAAEVQALLSSMDGVEISAHCPHGRPVAAEIGRAQVEALFSR
jgi:DNA mismatch repair protein MutL